jgi:hypothetical protein
MKRVGVEWKGRRGISVGVGGTFGMGSTRPFEKNGRLGVLLEAEGPEWGEAYLVRGVSGVDSSFS